jgi:hypothetical protein
MALRLVPRPAEDDHLIPKGHQTLMLTSRRAIGCPFNSFGPTGRVAGWFSADIRGKHRADGNRSGRNRSPTLAR